MTNHEKHEQYIFTRKGLGNIDRDAIEVYGMRGTRGVVHWHSDWQ